MITLWDGWAITSDEYQFILGRPAKRLNKKTNTDEDIMRDATYHLTLSQAVAAFHKKQLMASIKNNEHTLSTALSTASSIEHRIRGLLNKEQYMKEAKSEAPIKI